MKGKELLRYLNDREKISERIDELGKCMLDFCMEMRKMLYRNLSILETIETDIKECLEKNDRLMLMLEYRKLRKFIELFCESVKEKKEKVIELW